MCGLTECICGCVATCACVWGEGVDGWVGVCVVVCIVGVCVAIYVCVCVCGSVYVCTSVHL